MVVRADDFADHLDRSDSAADPVSLTVDDAKLLAVVAALRTDALPAQPDATFRDELRQQLMARAVELMPAGAPAPARSRLKRAPKEVRRLTSMPRRTSMLRRLISVGLAAATVVLLLLGVSTWISRDAVPGDALYGMKRAKESVSLSLASGDSNVGWKKLTLAETRIDEVDQLLTRAKLPGAAPVVDDRTTKLVQDTIKDSDEDIQDGTRLMSTAAVRNVDARSLETPKNQLSLLADKTVAVYERLPDGALRERARASVVLVTNALARIAALQRQIGCSCVTVDRADALGPLPCPTPCSTLATGTGPSSSAGTLTSAATVATTPVPVSTPSENAGVGTNGGGSVAAPTGGGLGNTGPAGGGGAAGGGAGGGGSTPTPAQTPGGGGVSIPVGTSGGIIDGGVGAGTGGVSASATIPIATASASLGPTGLCLNVKVILGIAVCLD